MPFDGFKVLSRANGVQPNKGHNGISSRALDIRASSQELCILSLGREL